LGGGVLVWGISRARAGGYSGWYERKKKK